MKVNYLIKFGLFILILSLTAINTTSCNTREQREESSRAVLEDVAIWFIKEGLSEFYKNKDLLSLEKSIKDRGAYLFTEIAIEKYGYMANVIAECFWVRSIINCYARVESDYIYEYWVVDRFGGTRKDVPREIYFLIAKSEGLDKPREIIHRTTKFFPHFTLSDQTVINFPMDNKSIYRLRPWNYPKSFLGTDLENVKVVIENDQYIKKVGKTVSSLE